MALWTIETCPACEGSGFRYCQRCEATCEHDRACGRCHGHGEVPARVEGMGVLAVRFGLGGSYYPTRTATAAQIEADSEEPRR